MLSSSVRFARAHSVRGCWVLFGLSSPALAPVCSRLFLRGASLVSVGCSLGSGLSWVAFKCPAELAAQLALLFPAPAGSAPLLVSRGRVLSGAVAARARVSGPGGCVSLSVAVQLQVVPGQLPVAG